MFGVLTSAAAAETRTLKLYFLHTKEHASITYKKNGRYIPSGLKELNRFLRDWRRNEPTKMDPRLFDLIWEVYQASGSRAEIHVVSAYRSPQTNAMLRKRSSGVAKKSQHTLGKAMDFFIPDVPLKKLRELGMKFQVGGVGYYPRSGSPFVHLDTGSVRAWPRMSRKELVQVFPQGKTLHLPSDGKPLPGYDQALADYKKRVTSNSIEVAGGGARSSSSGGGGLLAGLFNRGDDEDEAPARQQRSSASQVAQAEPENDEEEIELAYVPVPRSRPSLSSSGVQLALADAGAANGDNGGVPLVPVPVGAQTEALAAMRPDDVNGTDAIKVASLTPARSAASADVDRIIRASENGLPAPVQIEDSGSPTLAYVPMPTTRPDRQTVEVASIAGVPTPRPARAGFEIPLPESPIRGALDTSGGQPQAGSKIALAPPSVAQSESGRDVLAAAIAASASQSTGGKSARRARASDDAAPKYVVNTSPVLTAGLASKRSITSERVETQGNAIVAPQLVSAHLREAPHTVHLTGFSTENTIASAESFSGNAVNFLTVARFSVTN
ncbi:DUF882 domain-containing protein [Hoeflea sp. WL0058]|uniref:Murein endopeptidase K n=1 Tax=Flavimaribacter sediminis TaxID=2865987 RepID=A0AAE2ZLM9_9HYPH|nr:DUF882 domain-containing protein [Flavimaribacter sediminis]MBW8639139.1 DUF882 domain-containing protein [Flavimaribacter sediminis]